MLFFMFFQADYPVSGGEIVEYVRKCAVLACLLEASMPKPGNISPFHNSHDTRYSHFLASSVAIDSAVTEAAIKGVETVRNKQDPSRIKMGSLIFDAVSSTKKWHRGGNTNLGIILLLIPLCVASGISLIRREGIVGIRRGLEEVLRATTVKDSVYVVKAINVASCGGLGSVPEFDVCDEEKTLWELREKNVSLLELFQVSASWDNISQEYVSAFDITFSYSYPVFIEAYNSSEGDVEKAILQCFLELLAVYPDSLIARKFGIEVAEQVSEKASEIVRAGGIFEPKNFQKISKFDDYLWSNNHNPGTTADLVTAAIYLGLIAGIRP